jgi:hypothetical protein
MHVVYLHAGSRPILSPEEKLEFLRHEFCVKENEEVFKRIFAIHGLPEVRATDAYRMYLASSCEELPKLVEDAFLDRVPHVS